MADEVVRIEASGEVLTRVRPNPTRPIGPEEGARLIRAFVGVKSPELRAAIVAFVEKLAKAA